MPRRAYLWILGLPVLITVLLAAGSCSSNKPTGLGAGCSVNSDCSGALICAFGLCHVACVTSKDCSGGATCLPPGECELPQESTCSATLPCVTGLVCASDSCKAPCSPGIPTGSPGGCLGGQTCTMVAGATDSVCLDNGDGGAPDGSTGGDGGNGGDGMATDAESGSDASSDVNTPPKFSFTAQGDSNPSFTSGVGVRASDTFLIFSGYAEGDAGTDNAVYVQAFNPATGNALGAAEPLFDAPAGAGFVVQSASIAPTGQIALAFSYGGLFNYTGGGGHQSTLYAAFLGASADAGQAGLALERTVEIESATIVGQPHVIWSVPAGAFVFSWEYSSSGSFVAAESFLPNGQPAGDIDPVPSAEGQACCSYDIPSAAAGPTLLAVGVAYGGSGWLTIFDTSGTQVGDASVGPFPAGGLWETVAATAQGFVYLSDNNGLSERFVPTSGASVVLPDDDAAAAAGFTLMGSGRAWNGHAISDDTGGLGGVGVAVLYANGLSFLYVKADGTTYTTASVIAHTYASGDQINITNFGGSFGLSLYSGASQSTQMVASE